MKTYKKIAKYQNMSVARAKAIQIMESLPALEKLEGVDWFTVEDLITKIINSK